MASSSLSTHAATSAAEAAAATADLQETPTVAAIIEHLRALIETLDTGGTQSAAQVGASLQQLAQQLITLAPAAAAAPGKASAPAEAPGTDGTIDLEAACKEFPAQAAGAGATDVAMLERSYGAPAVPGVADAEPAALQPLTKKQRQAAKTGGQPRVLDFSKYQQRSVVLQLMYVGWSYQGFARQADSDNTIEGVLFPALRRVKLIPEDVEISSLGYSRCGRTDKGVSALGQVLCLKLRSAALAGQPLPPADQELDYLTLINRALPETIRVLGWCDVPAPDFSARFSCSSREYKYFIVQDGSLDLPAMRQAAQHLLGEHDFRHFCKADVLQVQNFMRCVQHVALEPVACCCPGMTVLALHIKGTAFLWHQIRCIAAVLLMVGRGLEAPDVVQQLLDIQRVPCKPQYGMAAEEPLLLFRCSFDDVQHWQRTPTSLARNLAAVNTQLQQHLVAAALTNAIYEQLQQDWQQLHNSSGQQQQWQQQDADAAQCIGNGGSNSSSTRWLPPKPQHIPLLKRATEPSMEERFSKAGISLEVLNQPGGARLKGDDG